MSNIELHVRNPEITPNKIQWNKEEIKQGVIAITAKYTNLIYSEEQIKEAKKDRAKLNALKKIINEKRISIKNEFMSPYLLFDSEVKEIVELIDLPIKSIDGQVKQYELEVKKKKQEDLELYFTEASKEIKDFLVFNDVFDQKYLNTSFSLKRAKEDILKKIQNIKTSLNTLEEIDDEQCRLVAVSCFKKSLNIQQALDSVNRLKEEKRIEKERQLNEIQNNKEKNEAEPNRLASEKQNILNVSEKHVKELDVNNEVVDPFFNQNNKARKLFKSKFTVIGTKEQLIELREYLIKNEIKFIGE